MASGANGDITVEDIEKSRPAIEAADILLLQLEIPIPAVLKAAQIAHAAGAYVVLNPAPMAALPEQVWENISLVTPNETELSIFSGRQVGDEAGASEAVKALQAKGVKDVIVTMGSKGSLICEGEGRDFVQARRVKAIDTTGAGDTYSGALCVALSEGKSLKEAAEFATAASALSVQKMGAQNSMPYRSELQPD